MRRTIVSLSVLGVVVLTCSPTLWAHGDEYKYSWHGVGHTDFAGKTAGQDMLPYTPDDLTTGPIVPAPDVDIGAPSGDVNLGNIYGTWSQGHMDNGAPNVFEEETDFLFTIVRDPLAIEDPTTSSNDDYAMHAYDRPEYGIMTEDEDWNGGLREAFGRGPLGDPDTGLDATFTEDPLSWFSAAAGLTGDFSLHDNGWDDENSQFAYNNIQDNQHGLGLSKYTMILDDTIFDEVEGFTLTTRPTHNVDRDPCRRWMANTSDQGLQYKGFLFPVEDLVDARNNPDGVTALSLKNLESPFGWEASDFDWHGWLTGEILPRLNSAGFHTSCATCVEGGIGLEPLPVTHIRLMWRKLDAMTPGDGCTPQKYYGVPDEGAPWREFHISAINADSVNDVLLEPEGFPLFSTAPDDGAELNMWVYTHFICLSCSSGEPLDPQPWRGSFVPADVTDEEEGTKWRNELDPDFGARLVAHQHNKHMLQTGPGAAVMPILPATSPRGGLTGEERPVTVVVEVAEDAEGSGVENFQVALHSDAGVLAYVNFSDTVSVSEGGTMNADGSIAGGAGTAGTVPTTFGVFDRTGATSEYTRWTIEVTEDAIRVTEEEEGTYVATDFNDLGLGTVLVDHRLTPAGGLVVGGGSVITAVSVSADGAAGWSTLAVLAGYPGPGSYVRGDADCSGFLDLTDAIYLFNNLFSGGPGPCCPQASDANGDGITDLSDGVFSLNHKFLGAAPPPQPYPDCGSFGCASHPTCD